LFTAQGDRAIALAVARDDYDRMKTGVPYQLMPANSKDDAKWAVNESATLTK
jgi:hypothetical protein